MTEKCIEIKDDGERCGAYPVQGSEYCVVHDPELAAQRAAWRKSGGHATRTPEGKPVELVDVEDVRKGLAAVIGSTWRLSNSGERTRALTSAYGMALKTFEVGELEERVEALEQRLADIQAGAEQPQGLPSLETNGR